MSDKTLVSDIPLLPLGTPILDGDKFPVARPALVTMELLVTGTSALT